MKYLFLLLVLAGCGQGEEKKKAEAIKAEAMASADAVVEEMNDRDAISALIAAYKRTNTAPDPKVLITNHLDELEWVNPLDYTNSPRDIVPFRFVYDNDVYVLIYTNTPYINEYPIFLSNQLLKYGRDIQGRRIIDSKELEIFQCFSISDDELPSLYPLYTPYTHFYISFFSNQLLKYGRDKQGRRIINSKELYSLGEDLQE